LKEPDGGNTRTSQIGRYSGYGITLGLSIALFTWLGLKLDEKLGTEPLFVLVGAFLGFGGGFYRMYRELVVVPRKKACDEAGSEG
jgi:F0F1-type ATP synthase assembly protein I